MKEEIIKTLKDLLKYKTYKENIKEFDKLFNYIKKKYSNTYIEEYVFDNNKSLVLSNTNDTNLDIIFCTHIDVVHDDDYSYIEDIDNIYGRGTIDMKAQVAVCLTFISNINTDKKIGLFITSDEEITGNCAYQLSKIYNSKFVIVPDGGKNFNLVIEEKGLVQLEISIKTKSAHASQPFNGENAIIKLIEVYNKILEKYPLPKSSEEYITSINLSKICGGVSNNQVPDYASMTLDIRNIDKDNQEDIITYIKSISKNIEIKIITQGGTFNTDLKNKYVKKYIKATEKILGKKVNKVGCESTSAAIFFYEKNIPTIIMNPIGDYAHCPNEYVNKDSLIMLYNIYEEFLKEM